MSICIGVEDAEYIQMKMELESHVYPAARQLLATVAQEAAVESTL